VKDFSIFSRSLLIKLCRYFFTARRAVNVLEKLHLAAALVVTRNKKGLAALFAYVSDEGLAAAMGAGDMKRSAAAGTDTLSLIDDAKTGGTEKCEGAPASAGRAEPGVPVDQGTTVHTGLFVTSRNEHLRPLQIQKSYKFIVY